jgi:PAS domain S-box-containing protein
MTWSPGMTEPHAHAPLESALTRAEHAKAGSGAFVDQPREVAYVEELDSGRVLSISPQVEAILGFTQEEWLGDANLWIDRLHPDDRDRVIQACVLANQAQEPFRAEYRMIAREGHVVWILDEAVLVRGWRGQAMCWQGAMKDITADKKTGA